jgi:hypothetical protein
MMNRNSWLREVVKPQLGAVQWAVEVGVWRGDYSQIILDALQPERFFGVDPYELYEGYTDKPDVNEFANQKNLDALCDRVCNRFVNWGHTLYRLKGSEGAAVFSDETFDFVYLDGDHKYDAVVEDIAAWWPKVKPGGILAGHDYIERSHIEEFGVIPAVTEFCERYNLKVQTTSESFATWWVTK